MTLPATAPLPPPPRRAPLPRGTASGEGTPIQLGGIGPVTGANAQYGTAVQNGEQLAVDEINAAAGYTVFELSFEDDESDSEKAVNAFNTLLDNGMQILLGPVTSDPSISVAAECASDNIFMLTPSASSQDVVDTGAGTAFQMCFTDPNQGKTAADYIADNSLGSAIGIIYDSSDAYSTGIYTAFEAEAEARGLNIVQTSSFTADNNTDLSTQVSQCQQAGADLVFLPIYYQQASQVLIAANNIGYAPTFFGCDGMDGILSIDGFDTSLANGLMLLCPFSAYGEDETTTTFVAAYQAAYGETPNQFAADCLRLRLRCLPVPAGWRHQPRHVCRGDVRCPEDRLHLHDVLRHHRCKPDLVRGRHHHQGAQGLPGEDGAYVLVSEE